MYLTTWGVGWKTSVGKCGGECAFRNENTSHRNRSNSRRQWTGWHAVHLCWREAKEIFGKHAKFLLLLLGPLCRSLNTHPQEGRDRAWTQSIMTWRLTTQSLKQASPGTKVLHLWNVSDRCLEILSQDPESTPYWFIRCRWSELQRANLNCTLTQIADRKGGCTK